MRQLTLQEIAQLESFHCTADDWQSIWVREPFTPSAYYNVSFSGVCYLGCAQKRTIEHALFPSRRTGIYHATISNCTIGDEVYIGNVSGGIAGYVIEDGCIISDVYTLSHTPSASTYGIGTALSVLDETGGRSVRILPQLSAAMAYIQAFGKADEALMQKLEQLIEKEAIAIRSQNPTIGKGSLILNSGTIKEVTIGAKALIHGITRLEEGTIASQVTLQDNVSAEHFIIAKESTLHSATLKHCYVGEGCLLEGNFYAHDTLIFANATLANGEASAAFLGPYTVSMHRSTLLIGVALSFFNAGSGTNSSNHHYRLGPIHHGLLERGVKCGSNAYLLWPAHIGAFSKVIGTLYRNPDVAHLPFSQLNSDGKEIEIAPSITISHIGTWRDVYKWPKRDRRTTPPHDDVLNFELFTPALLNAVWEGYKTLSQAEQLAEQGQSFQHLLGGCTATPEAISYGRKLYHAIIATAIAQKVSLEEATAHIANSNTAECGTSKEPLPLQFDLMGATVFYQDYLSWRNEVVAGSFETIASAQQALAQATDNKPQERLFFARLTQHIAQASYPQHTSPKEQIQALFANIPQEIEYLRKRVYKDGTKEYQTSRALTPFGLLPLPEEPQPQLQDFRAVRQGLVKQAFAEEISQYLQSLIEKIRT